MGATAGPSSARVAVMASASSSNVKNNTYLPSGRIFVSFFTERLHFRLHRAPPLPACRVHSQDACGAPAMTSMLQTHAIPRVCPQQTLARSTGAKRACGARNLPLDGVHLQRCTRVYTPRDWPVNLAVVAARSPPAFPYAACRCNPDTRADRSAAGELGARSSGFRAGLQSKRAPGRRELQESSSRCWPDAAQSRCVVAVARAPLARCIRAQQPCHDLSHTWQARRPIVARVAWRNARRRARL